MRESAFGSRKANLHGTRDGLGSGSNPALTAFDSLVPRHFPQAPDKRLGVPPMRRLYNYLMDMKKGQRVRLRMAGEPADFWHTGTVTKAKNLEVHLDKLFGPDVIETGFADHNDIVEWQDIEGGPIYVNQKVADLIAGRD